MAESLDSDAELTVSNELLRCNICYDKFKQPRTLPCLHTFCECCLQRHIETSVTARNNNNYVYSSKLESSLDFACPTCREKVRLPAHGVLGFRHDFRIEQMQDLVRKAAKSKQASNGKRSCQFCSKYAEEGTVSSFCLDCLKEICQACATKHKRLPIFADHRISGDADTAPRKRTVCPGHPSEDIGYLCMTCNQAICAICVMSDEHNDHLVSVLRVGLQQYQEDLSSQSKTLHVKLTHLREINQSLADHERAVNDIRAKLDSKIKQRAELLVEAIHTQENNLRTELNQRCNSELSRIRAIREKLDDALTGMGSIQDFVRSLLRQDMNVDMVAVYRDIIEKIDHGFEDSLLLKYERNFKLEFADSARKVKLGRLFYPPQKGDAGEDDDGVDMQPERDVTVSVVPVSPPKQSPRTRRRAKMAASKDHVKLKKPVAERRRGSDDLVELPKPGSTSTMQRRLRLVAKFGRFGSNGGEFSSPRDLCFMDDGQLLVVADTNNDRLQVFNSDGLLIRVIGQGRLKPWGVTATPAGNIAVTDNLEKCVKIYDKLGNLLNKFGRFLCPCGIAVGQAGDFIVTDFFSTFAFVLSRHGRSVNQFELRGKTDQHMCGASRVAVASGGNIIISDVSNGCVKTFDKRGKLLHVVVNPANLISPQGVAVDSNGHVMVADAMKQHVAVMDGEGRHLGTVLQCKNDYLKDPTGLAICNNHLALTQMKTNQVNVYTFEGDLNSMR